MMEQERRYSKGEREALAVVFAVKKFRLYRLKVEPFTVNTYHQAVQTDFKKKYIKERFAMWRP